MTLSTTDLMMQLGAAVTLACRIVALLLLLPNRAGLIAQR